MILDAPLKKVQDFRQIKPAGATSWVWDHFTIYDPKYQRTLKAVCNICFLKYTTDDFGNKVDGNCANWEIAYGGSKSTSKLDNHLSFRHKDIHEAHNRLKAVTAVASDETMESFVVHGEKYYANG